MRFAFSDLGQTLRDELRSASSAKIAVAYFNPDDTLLSALLGIPELKLIVSDDFQMNNPYKLEVLHQSASLGIVPADGDAGKLHAKVFLVYREDGRRWALVGSANLTWPALFSNQEACMIVDSSEVNGESILGEIEAWFVRVEESSEAIDLAKAKATYDSRLTYRVVRTAPAQDAIRHWALKTSEGSGGPSHWQDFVAENVIAIGWPLVGVDPTDVSRDDLEAALKHAYPDEDTKRAATKILRFANIAPGDVALICRGYNSEQTPNVHIYGVARVTGPFRYEPNSGWWIFKRDAILQVVDQKLPVDTVRNALNKNSLMQTLHSLTPQEFDRFAAAVQDALGITITV
jgi:HKD family nuclease